MKSIKSLKTSILLVLLFLNLYFFSGCQQKPQLSSEEKKSTIEQTLINSFLTNNKLNYQLDINTKIVGKTFWIYIATDQEIISLETQPSEELLPKIIKFIDVKSTFKNSNFTIEYIFLKNKPDEYSPFLKNRDILQEKSLLGKELYPETTNQFLEIFQKTYVAIGDIISDVRDINFFVIAIADIKRGIKSTLVIHKLDLEKSLLNILPYNEFSNRIFRRNVKDPEIKNDKYGLHIKYIDISLIDFLNNQIESKVFSKLYEMLKFEAKKVQELEDIQEIILKSLYEVVILNYEFYDFYVVDVTDMISKKSFTISKSSLIKKFKE